MSSSAIRARWTSGQPLDEFERLALRTPSRAQFFDEAAARLKRVVPFDGACWHTLDPGSGLITQHHLQDLPDRFPVLAENEYSADDVNKFSWARRLAARSRGGGGRLAAEEPRGVASDAARRRRQGAA